MRKIYIYHMIAIMFIAGLSVPGTGSAKEIIKDQEDSIIGYGGAVATEDPQASEAAMSMLEMGGNAIDAAIAAAAVQGVIRPFSGGIGGGGMMLVYLAEEDKHVSIDNRSQASQSFGPDTLIDPETGLVYSSAIRRTNGAVTSVPGAVKAWEEALEKYGTMSLKQVLKPAIDIAEKGFIVDSQFEKEASSNEERFRLFKSTKDLYFDDDGNLIKAGSLLKNPDLAHTYRLIGEHGSDIFYEGDIAEEIVETVNNPPVIDNPDFSEVSSFWDPKIGVIGGNMTMADLRNYEIISRKPITTTYRDYDVYGVPPASSGGITIGQTFNILENYDLATMSKVQALHYYMEATRLAFADRRAYIGDPAFSTVPIEGLLSKGYAEERRRLIDDDRAVSDQLAPGDPWPYEKNPDKWPEEEAELVALEEGNVKEQEEPIHDIADESTIHLSVSDQQGNVVSYTSTIVSIGGNGMVVPGRGFLLNNALYGRIPSKDPSHPNYPRPGMRSLSSMAPTIIMKDGSPVLTLGSPGSDTIITTLLQVMINNLDFGMPLNEAIAEPRINQRNNFNGLGSYEEIFLTGNEDLSNVLTGLEKMGHEFYPVTATQGIGAVTGIEFLANGQVMPAAEPTRRGGGSAMVQSLLPLENLEKVRTSAIVDVVSVIDALPTHITPGDRELVEAARQKVSNAFSLGVNEMEIHNLSKLKELENQLKEMIVFNDLIPDNLFYYNIYFLVERKIINGYLDGSFRERNTVTRAEAATMLGRALHLDGTRRDADFVDVSAKNYASGFIQSAVEEGIIKGFPDGSFQPNNEVTRGQMAVLIARAFKLETEAKSNFSDVKSTNYAYTAIRQILHEEITDGFPDGTYRPGEDVTRGQFSAFLSRALDESFIPHSSME